MRRLPTPKELELAKQFDENRQVRIDVNTVDREKIKSELVIFNIQKQILEQRNIVSGANCKMGILKQECEALGHLIAPSWAREHKWPGDTEPRGDFGGAHCLICMQSFGWYCPDSPDHICRYTKSRDYCDYCGYPEERK